MILGTAHAVFPVDDASRVGEARRYGALLAQQAGFNELTAGRLALIVTELGTNLHKHARGGRLLLARRGPDCVEAISIDSGPGMRNVAQSLGDGYSTGGSPGTGLGAIRRLAGEFHIHSSVPEGTVIVARIGARDNREVFPPAEAGRFRMGAIAVAMPGESACGDAWAFASDGARAAMFMADGLGHGPDAAQAAHAAVGVFERRPLGEPRETLEQTHVALRPTRGAAVSLCLLDAGEDLMRSVGAGNVVTRVISGVSDRSVLSQHGTAGLQIRRPEEVRTPWPRFSVVVMHTDGILTRWPSQSIVALLAHDPSLAAAVLMRDFCRGHDDATVMIVRRKD